MAMNLHQLRETPDERLIELHDEIAGNTNVLGINYYLAELQRRDTARAMQASHKLATRAYWLAVVNGVVAVVAVIVAIVAIVLHTNAWSRPGRATGRRVFQLTIPPGTYPPRRPSRGDHGSVTMAGDGHHGHGHHPPPANF